MPRPRPSRLEAHFLPGPPDADGGALLARLAGLKPVVLLDSSNGIGHTILGVGGETVACWPEGPDPLAALEDHLARYAVRRHRRWPFLGGLMGWFGYDARLLMEPLPDQHPRETQLPDVWWGAFWVVVLRDEIRRETVVCHLEDPEDRGRTQAARDLAGFVAQTLLDPKGEPGPLESIPKRTIRRPDAESHRERIRRALSHIGSGDIYQVNLAQRFETDRPKDLVSLYRRLRQRNPAAFGGFVAREDDAFLSVSPERFLRVDRRTVRTRPIKGTAPRHSDPDQDRALKRGLARSAKDRAELAMIIDVMRNDLSRVCLPGSVVVSRPLMVETHPTVHHLVAEVQGRFETGRGRVDLLRATFPGGSVTGAPRIRAMEIIDQLEAQRRGPYCGSLGYMGYDGRMDSNILIRTVISGGSRLFVYGGGGIVADSDPESETLETWHKVRGIVGCLEGDEDGKPAEG